MNDVIISILLVLVGLIVGIVIMFIVNLIRKITIGFVKNPVFS